MPFRSGDEFLAHVLQAFRPYLDTLILIGGFTVRLYELHPRATGLFATPGSPGVVEAHRALTAELAGSGTEAPTTGRIHAGIQAFLQHF
jgi:hypothetical protein